jgi:hypothetical protein
MEVMGYDGMNNVNEFNATTGEEIQRPFTAEELKEYKRIQKAVEAAKAALEAQAIIGQ